MLNSKFRKTGFVLLCLLYVGLLLDRFSYKAVASSIGTFIGNATGASSSNASFNVPTATGVSATQQFNTNAAGTRVFTPGVVYGLDQLGGNMFPLWVGGNGLITGNANTAGADGISNTGLNNADSANTSIYTRNWNLFYNGATWDRMRGTAAGGMFAQGPAASGATAAGNPFKAGGVFNTTQPTVTNGQVVDEQMTARGAQIVATGVDTFSVSIGASTDAVLGCVLQSAASTNSTSCKGSAGSFYGVRAVNTTATLYFLRMYNSSGAPTCSSATGFIESIPIPASTTGAGIAAIQPIGISYGTGIGFCFTGGGSSTDNTNAATGVYLTILYK